MAADTTAAHAATRTLQELQPVAVEVYDGADGTGRRTIAHEDPDCTHREGFGQYKDQLCIRCVSADPNLDASWHRWFRIRSELSWFTSIVTHIEKAEAAVSRAERVPRSILVKRCNDVAKAYQAVIDPAWVHPPACAPTDSPQLTATIEAWAVAAAAVRDLVLRFIAAGDALELYTLSRAIDPASETNQPQVVALTGNFPSLQTVVLESQPALASTTDGRRCALVGYDTWCALLDEDDPVAQLITHATIPRTALADQDEEHLELVLELALTAYNPEGPPFADVHAGVAAAHR